MITEHERAGHALRARRPKLAEAVVAEQYRRQPDLIARYGADGDHVRRVCVRDVGYHIDALAASVDLGDPARFAAYVAWARDTMAAHGVPPSDLVTSLEVLRDVAAAHLPPAAAEAACRHIDAGFTKVRPG